MITGIPGRSETRPGQSKAEYYPSPRVARRTRKDSITMNEKKAPARMRRLDISNPTPGELIPLGNLPYKSNGTVVVGAGYTLDYIMWQVSPMPGSPGPWQQIPPSQIKSSVNSAAWYFYITHNDCLMRGSYTLNVVAYETKAGKQSQVPSKPVTFKII
jgi:hypothetical protein